MRKALIVLGVALISQPALASPFCMLILGGSPMCIYDDAGLCQKDSAKQGGECEPNPDGAIRSQASGSGQYCLVLSSGASQCAYLDIDSCKADALKQNGACYFDAVRGAGVANPYQYFNNPPGIPADAAANNK